MEITRSKPLRIRRRDRHRRVNPECVMMVLRSRGGSALPGCRVQNAFAEAKRFWRRFHVFIRVDVFDGALKAHPQWCFELDSLPFTLTSHVSQMKGRESSSKHH